MCDEDRKDTAAEFAKHDKAMTETMKSYQSVISAVIGETLSKNALKDFTVLGLLAVKSAMDKEDHSGLEVVYKMITSFMWTIGKLNMDIAALQSEVATLKVVLAKQNGVEHES